MRHITLLDKYLKYAIILDETGIVPVVIGPIGTFSVL